MPDAPGLGVELSEAVVKEHLRRPGFFDASTKWDDSYVGRGPGHCFVQSRFIPMPSWKGIPAEEDIIRIADYLWALPKKEGW